MYRALFKFAVTTITILTVNLVTSKISDYLISYKNQSKPITFTLISMGIITLIFYPLFIWLEDGLNMLSVRLVKSGKSFGGRYIGLISIYLVCLAVLLYFYAQMWFNIDVLKILFKGKIMQFI